MVTAGELKCFLYDPNTPTFESKSPIRQEKRRRGRWKHTARLSPISSGIASHY